MNPIGSPNSTIRQTVAQLGIDPTRNHNADHARLLNSGPPHLQLHAYSVTTYPANEATTTARIYQALDIAQQQTFGAPNGQTIPWNPNWHLPNDAGNDRIIDIIGTDGRVFDLWMVRNDPWARLLAALHLPNLAAGYNANNPNHLVIGAVAISSTNIHTAEDYDMAGQRGAGLIKPAGVLRALEVLGGNIGHALSLTISNPAYGVYNQAGQLTEPIPHRGPAKRLEHLNPNTLGLGHVTGNGGTPTRPLDQTIASGHRYAHNLTDTELTTIATHNITDPTLRTTAHTIGRALRDYGALVLETGGYGLGLETDGDINPTTRNDWTRAGVTTTTTAQLDAYLLELLHQTGRWFTINERNVTRP